MSKSKVLLLVLYNWFTGKECCKSEIKEYVKVLRSLSWLLSLVKERGTTACSGGKVRIPRYSL